MRSIHPFKWHLNGWIERISWGNPARRRSGNRDYGAPRPRAERAGLLRAAHSLKKKRRRPTNQSDNPKVTPSLRRGHFNKKRANCEASAGGASGPKTRGPILAGDVAGGCAREAHLARVRLAAPRRAAPPLYPLISSARPAGGAQWHQACRSGWIWALNMFQHELNFPPWHGTRGKGTNVVLLPAS